MATPNGTKTPSSMGPKVLFYSILLTLQYGAQPRISKHCIGKEVIVTSSVLTCEIVKVLSKEWTLMGSLTASGLPAAIYALQNSLLQISCKCLDYLTFSIHSTLYIHNTKIIMLVVFLSLWTSVMAGSTPEGTQFYIVLGGIYAYGLFRSAYHLWAMLSFSFYSLTRMWKVV